MQLALHVASTSLRKFLYRQKWRTYGITNNTRWNAIHCRIFLRNIFRAFKWRHTQTHFIFDVNCITRERLSLGLMWREWVRVHVITEASAFLFLRFYQRQKFLGLFYYFYLVYFVHCWLECELGGCFNVKMGNFLTFYVIFIYMHNQIAIFCTILFRQVCYSRKKIQSYVGVISYDGLAAAAAAVVAFLICHIQSYCGGAASYNHRQYRVERGHYFVESVKVNTTPTTEM